MPGSAAASAPGDRPLPVPRGEPRNARGAPPGGLAEHPPSRRGRPGHPARALARSRLVVRRGSRAHARHADLGLDAPHRRLAPAVPGLRRARRLARRGRAASGAGGPRGGAHAGRPAHGRSRRHGRALRPPHQPGLRPHPVRRPGRQPASPLLCVSLRRSRPRGARRPRMGAWPHDSARRQGHDRVPGTGERGVRGAGALLRRVHRRGTASRRVASGAGRAGDPSQRLHGVLRGPVRQAGGDQRDRRELPDARARAVRRGRADRLEPAVVAHLGARAAAADRLLLLPHAAARQGGLHRRLQRQRGGQHDRRGDPPGAARAGGARSRRAVVVQPRPPPRPGSRRLRRPLAGRAAPPLCRRGPPVLGARPHRRPRDPGGRGGGRRTGRGRGGRHGPWSPSRPRRRARPRRHRAGPAPARPLRRPRARAAPRWM